MIAGEVATPRPEPQDGKIRQLFRQAVTAIMPKAPAPAPQPSRRKRSGDTDTGSGFARAARRFMRHIARRVLPRQFRQLADQLRQPPAFSILDNLYAPRPYDPEAERAYAEQVLREQMEEWSQEDEQEQDGAFHYAKAGGFDPQP